MRSHYESYQALCPFYKCEDRTVIYCEGLTEDSSIHHAFALDKAAAASDYKARFCCRDWELCRIAKMLNEKYQ